MERCLRNTKRTEKFTYLCLLYKAKKCTPEIFAGCSRELLANTRRAPWSILGVIKNWKGDGKRGSGCYYKSVNSLKKENENVKVSNSCFAILTMNQWWLFINKHPYLSLNINLKGMEESLDSLLLWLCIVCIGKPCSKLCPIVPVEDSICNFGLKI